MALVFSDIATKLALATTGLSTVSAFALSNADSDSLLSSDEPVSVEVNFEPAKMQQKLDSMAENIRRNEGKVALLKLAGAVDYCFEKAVNATESWLNLWQKFPERIFFTVLEKDMPADYKPFDGDPVESIQKCVKKQVENEASVQKSESLTKSVFKCLSNQLTGIKGSLEDYRKQFFSFLYKKQAAGICVTKTEMLTEKSWGSKRNWKRYESGLNCQDLESGSPICAQELCEAASATYNSLIAAKDLFAIVKDVVSKPCFLSRIPEVIESEVPEKPKPAKKPIIKAK